MSLRPYSSVNASAASTREGASVRVSSSRNAFSAAALSGFAFPRSFLISATRASESSGITRAAELRAAKAATTNSRG